MLVTLAALILLAPQAGQVATERERWEQARVAERAYRQRRFAEAGFQPIAEVEADGRSVRRLLLSDPYGFLPVPAVEFERLRDGKVAIRFQYRGWSTEPVPTAAGVWDDLARREAAVFMPPGFRPVPTRQTEGPPPPPPPICHGWSAEVAAGYRRLAGWWGCGGKESDPAYGYVVRMVEAAVGTRPDCTFDRDNPLWSFNTCFGAVRKLADPALDARVAALRAAYDAEPGADRLAEARRALNLPGLAVGTEAWIAARDAVGRFLAVQDARRATLGQLQTLAYTAPKPSEADRAQIEAIARGWSEFLRSQDANAVDLLRRLGWPTGERAATDG